MRGFCKLFYACKGAYKHATMRFTEVNHREEDTSLSLDALPHVSTRRVCPQQHAVRLFFLGAVTYSVALFGRMSYAAVTLALIAGEGFTKSQAGLIGTALFTVYGVSQFFTGFLGDRLSPKHMVFTGMLGSAVLNLLMSIGNYRLMLVLWALNGAFQALIWSPIFKVFSELLPPAYRKRACTNAAVTYPLATMIIYLLAALTLHTLGWRMVFIVSAVLMLAAALFWRCRMGFYEQHIAQNGDIEHIQLTTHEQKAGGKLLPLLVASGAFYAIAGAVANGMLRDGIQSWVPTFMTESFGFGASVSTALAILLPLVNMTGVVITNAIAKRWIANELRGAAAFFAVASLALIGLGALCQTSAVGSLAMMMLASTCMVGASIMLINLMPIHFGAVQRAASVTGVLNCAAYAGSALSSYGIGRTADLYGWQSAVYVWLGFAAAALVSVLLGAKSWDNYRRKI